VYPSAWDRASRPREWPGRLARRTGGKAPVPLQGATTAVTKALDEIQACCSRPLASGAKRLDPRCHQGAVPRVHQGSGGLPTAASAAIRHAKRRSNATNATIAAPRSRVRSKESKTCSGAEPQRRGGRVAQAYRLRSGIAPGNRDRSGRRLILQHQPDRAQYNALHDALHGIRHASATVKANGNLGVCGS